MKNGLLRSPTVQVRVSTDKKGLKRVNTNRHGPNPITSPYIQNCRQGMKIQMSDPGCFITFTECRNKISPWRFGQIVLRDDCDYKLSVLSGKQIRT